MLKPYACISERDGSIAFVRDYDDAVVATWPAEKRRWYRPVIEDAAESITATQAAALQPNPALWTIEADRVVVPWVVRDLTAAELDAKTDAAELQIVFAMIAALKAGTGTAAERLVRIERCVAWLLKQAAKRGVL